MNPESLAALTFGLGVATVVFLAAWVVTSLRLDAMKGWATHWKESYETTERRSDGHRDRKYELEREVTILKERLHQYEQTNQAQADRLTEIVAAASGIPCFDGRAAEKASLKAAKRSIEAAMAVVDEAT